MSKVTLDPKTHVNEKAWYDESFVLKIWDQYIKSKKLIYYYPYEGNHNYVNSLFEGQDESLLSRNSAILLNNDNSIYLRKNANNNEINSISFCSLVCGKDISETISNFDLKINNLEISIRQLVWWNQDTNKQAIQNHIIVFPFYLGGPHWCLGTLQIKFYSREAQEASLYIFDPLAITKRINNNIAKNIETLINQILSINSNIIILNNKYNHLHKSQQNDTDSCGVITAENGKDIIDGSIIRLSKNYEKGTKSLRIQHLEEIANDVFTLRQRENITYSYPKVKLLDEYQLIMKELTLLLKNDTAIKKSFDTILKDINNHVKLDEATIVNNTKNLILTYKDKFKEHKVNETNLFSVFFIDDTGKYQDNAFDTLSYIMRNFNQPSLSYFKTNIFNYPERIPNYIHRKFLEKRLSDDLDNSRIAILTGLAGYGKTVLAMEYVYKHIKESDKYDQIIWLNCNELCPNLECKTKTFKCITWDKETKNFTNIFKSLSLDQMLPENPDYKYSHNITDTHKLITKELQGKKWLIVYDNISRYTDILQDIMPPEGHIICTSRYKVWPKSINVGPFTIDEGIRYFENIFFQSSESAAVEQYREKYFENMLLGIKDKAKCFIKSAEKLTKKLSGYPFALGEAARDISETGFTVEKYVQERRYNELFTNCKITLESIIGTNLMNSNTEKKAKQLLYFCVYLNHEGITRNILEEIDKRVSKSNFNYEIFNKAVNLLVYLSVINTDNSHATDYFYIPIVLKKILLDMMKEEKQIQETKSKNEPILNIQNVILEIINEKLTNHLLDSKCDGDEFVLPKQDIYMWVAHAKELYKYLEWRDRLSIRYANSEHSEYQSDEITNLLQLYISKNINEYESISIPLLSNCYLLKDADNNQYTVIDNDAYTYGIIVTPALIDAATLYSIEYKVEEIGGYKHNCHFLLAGEKDGLNFDNNDNNHYYVLIIPTPVDKHNNKNNINNCLDKIKYPASKCTVSNYNNDIFDEIKYYVPLMDDIHIKILFPYNVDNHWLTGEIKIHRINGIHYTIEISSHNPFGPRSLPDNEVLHLADLLTCQIQKYHKEATISKEIIKSNTYGTWSSNDNSNDEFSVIMEDILKRAKGHELNYDYYYGSQKNDLKKLFEEHNQNSLNHYKILIPCFSQILNYWFTIEIRLHKFKSQEGDIFKIQLLTHDPYGHGNILKDKLNDVYEKLLNNFTFALNIKNLQTEIIMSSFTPQLEDDDDFSSGPSTIRNIMDIIHGNLPNRKYSRGCKYTRYQQIAIFEQYATLNHNLVMYSNYENIKKWEKFLLRHWNLGYVKNKLQEQKLQTDNMKNLITTAEFMHCLSIWYYYHEMEKVKSYECLLECKVLYLQIIYIQTLIFPNEKYKFDKLYKSHLTNSINYQALNKNIYEDTKLSNVIADEKPNLNVFLSDLIKAYLQLNETFKYHLFNREIFNIINNQTAKHKELILLYSLSKLLHQTKEGFNDKTKKWTNALYKFLLMLLRSPYHDPNLKIFDINVFYFQTMKATDDEDKLFRFFESKEINGKTLYLLGLNQDKMALPELNSHIEDIFHNIMRYEIRRCKDKNAEGEIKQDIGPIKKTLIDYINNYFAVIQFNIISLYDKYLEYIVDYNDNMEKTKEIQTFINYFVNSINYNINDPHYYYLQPNSKYKFLINEYFFNDQLIHFKFYKVIYQRLIVDLSEYGDEAKRSVLIDKLMRLIKILNEMGDISGYIGFDRLKIKIQLHICLLEMHSANTCQLSRVPKYFNNLTDMTDNYYTIVSNQIKPRIDMQNMFNKSWKLFYQTAKLAFHYLELSLYKAQNNKFNKIQTNQFHKFNKTQTIMLKICLNNLLRAFTSLNIGLFHPQHPYFLKCNKFYKRVLKIAPHLKSEQINELDVNRDNKIVNSLEIDTLEKMLEKFNAYFDNNLDVKNNYEKYHEMLTIRYNRALICYILRRYDDALIDCTKLCEENRSYFKAFLFRAHIYYNMGRYHEAIADFKYYLKYFSGNYNAKSWLSLARKKKDLITEHPPLPYNTPKMRFVYAFTDEFLIQVKYYIDIALGSNKIFNRHEKGLRILAALSNLVPNISIEAPVGPVPVKLTADTQPREAALAITNMYAQQAEAQKMYIASNISQYHNELKSKVKEIALIISDDLERIINQLEIYSIEAFAQYSARKMLDSVGSNKTNPELPIEQQLRQGLFRYKSKFSCGIHLRQDKESYGKYLFNRMLPLPFNNGWTAEGALTRVGIFASSGHQLERRRFWQNQSNKYGYRDGSYEEAIKLGYVSKGDEEDVIKFIKSLWSVPKR